MSEYSYHGSRSDDYGVFLDNCELLNFQIIKSDENDKPDLASCPTNYIPQPLLLTTLSEIDLSTQSQAKYIKTRRGQSQQTMQLHTNFKTFIRKHLKNLIYLKLLTQIEYHNAIRFMKRTPSFDSFRALFAPFHETENLRKRMKKIFESAQAIKMILKSQVNMFEKLKMIKFIQKLRASIGQVEKKGWKSF